MTNELVIHFVTHEAVKGQNHATKFCANQIIKQTLINIVFKFSFKND